MQLSIIITTKNRIRQLKACIASILKADLAKVDWELVIVDDASTDGTEKLETKDFFVANLRIIHNQQHLMMVKSRNSGARTASGEYLLFIDDDNEIDANMITELLTAAENHESWGIIGPSIYAINNQKKYWDYQKINFFTSKTTSYIDTSAQQFCVSDGIPNVFLIKREVLEKCNYFDESLIQTLTEPDFHFQARQFGYQCMVNKKAITYHHLNEKGRFHPQSLGGDFSQKAYCLMRNRSLIIARYGRWYHKIVYGFCFSWFWPLIYSMVMLRYRNYYQLKLYWLGWRDGLIYLLTGKLINSIPKISTRSGQSK